MKPEPLLEEIRETNLTYLMLAQQMLRVDRHTAMYRLGIGQDVADLLAALTSAQVSKMASSNSLLCRIRCDDRVILEMLSGYGKARMLGEAHAAILLAGQPAGTIA
jgi:flagellar transcriptional activator FlhD